MALFARKRRQPLTKPVLTANQPMVGWLGRRQAASERAENNLFAHSLPQGCYASTLSPRPSQHIDHNNYYLLVTHRTAAPGYMNSKRRSCMGAWLLNWPVILGILPLGVKMDKTAHRRPTARVPRLLHACLTWTVVGSTTAFHCFTAAETAKLTHTKQVRLCPHAPRSGAKCCGRNACREAQGGSPAR